MKSYITTVLLTVFLALQGSSAAVIERTVAGCQIENNIQRPGSNYRTVKVTSFGNCVNLCANDPRCKVGSYKKDTSVCYLKDEVTAYEVNNNFQDALCHLTPAGTTTAATPPNATGA